MNKKLSSLFLIAILGVAFAYWFQQHRNQPTSMLVSSAPPTGGDFTLTSDTRKVSLHDYAGKVVLLYFGYTSCPDVCPTNLSNLAMAIQQLTPLEQQQVQVIMITVDPERDTMTKLNSYLPYFNKDFIGLTGSEAEITAVAKQYGAIFQKAPIQDSALGYAVDHSAFTYLIDQQGKLISQLPHATSPEDFVAAIKPLLTH